MRKEYPDEAKLAAFLAELGARKATENWIADYAAAAKSQFGVDDETFAHRLQAASTAHHAYETRLGKPDERWPAWYARHIILTEQAVSEAEAYIVRISRKPAKEARELAEDHVAEAFAAAAARHAEHPPHVIRSAFLGLSGLSAETRSELETEERAMNGLVRELHRSVLMHIFTPLGVSDKVAGDIVDSIILA